VQIVVHWEDINEDYDKIVWPRFVEDPFQDFLCKNLVKSLKMDPKVYDPENPRKS